MGNNSFDEVQELETLSKLTDEQLYLRLGSFDQTGGLPSDLINWGKERFKNLVTNLKDSICKNETIKLLCKDEEAKNHTEIIIALGAIIQTTAPAIPYITVAILIFRGGINKMCSSQWT